MEQKTRGGFRENSGRKKVGGGLIKRNIRFSDTDRDKVQRAADSCGMSFSAYVKKMALNAVENL